MIIHFSTEIDDFNVFERIWEIDLRMELDIKKRREKECLCDRENDIIVRVRVKLSTSVVVKNH